MAGKIIADTLEHSTAGSVTTDYVVNGSAKCWAWVDQYSDNAIDNSLNTSSFTDSSTGVGEVNLTSSMNTISQVSQLTTYRSGIPVTSGNAGASMTSVSAVQTVTKNTSDTVTDTEFGMTLHGDLA